MALARLLTFLGREQHSEEILRRLTPPARPARVVAVTGSAGVGKSTLIGKMLEVIRGQGESVAVLACDPQSPLSGGALLGDRFRMPTNPQDAGVLIRSLSTPGGHGAITESLGAMIRLLEAFPFDVVLIETVGAGQGDTTVRDLADVLVLLVQPETGDDLQWEKAGVLEVADVVVIHKADLPGADRVEAQVRSMLTLSQRAPAIVRVSARATEGLATLWQTIKQCPLRRLAAEPTQGLLKLAQQTLQTWFTQAQRTQSAALQAILERWERGELSASETGAAVCRFLVESSHPRS